MDKENNPVENSRDLLLRPPTTLKRPSQFDSQDAKKPKISGHLEKQSNISIQSKAENSGGKTFMMPTHPAKIGTNNPSIQKSVIKVNKTTQDSTLSRKPLNQSNYVKPAVPRQRQAWDVKGKLADLESAFRIKTEELNQRIDELQNEKMKVLSDLEDSSKKLLDFENSMTNLKEEKNILYELKCALEADLKNYQIKYDSLIKLGEEKDIEINNYKINLLNSESQIEFLRETLIKNQKQIELISMDLNQEQARLKNSRNEIDDKECQIRNLNKDIHEKKIEMIELFNKYDASLKCNNNINNKLEKEIESHKNLKKSYEELIMKIENKNKELSMMKCENDKLIFERDKISQDYVNELQKANDILKENADLKEKRQKDSEIISHLHSRIDELLRNCDSLTTNLGHFGTRFSHLQSEMNGYKKQIALSDAERREMHHKMMELRGTIRVCCRVRPILQNEDPTKICIIEFRNYENSLTISSNKDRDTVIGSKADATKYDFTFDAIFGPNSTQFQVFNEIEPLIQSALDGFSVCIFAYGQTGSGKTYTMEGIPENPDRTGMIERTVEKIFGSMVLMHEKGWKYEVECYFLEIYNETIRDLLVNDPKRALEKLDIKQKSTNIGSKSEKSKKNLGNKINDLYIPNLTIVKVHNTSEVKNLLNIANRNRSVASTKCNEFSSRSHGVFAIKLSGSNDLVNEKIEAFINLVDLAGSERIDQSGVEGDRLKETQCINKSLSTLKSVIASLSNKDGHVPFRDSKLTQLLRPSLGGNCKTLMFVNISPLEESYRESLNSLRFAINVNECYIGNATQNKISNKDSK